MHPQTMERNHLLSQVVQPLQTTTLTQLLDLFRNQSQVNSQISDIKGLTFDPMICVMLKVNLFHSTFFQNAYQLLN